MGPDLLITLIFLVGFALLLFWAVRTFLPQFMEPAQIIIGIVVLIALVKIFWPFISRAAHSGLNGLSAFV